MKMHHIFLFCLFSALCDGLVCAKMLIHTEGGSITAECTFSFSGRRKLLCRDACKDGGILIETKEEAAQRGRYSIKYKEGTFPVSSTVLQVSITQLTKSDSGQYWCVLKRPFLPDSHQEFEIRVTEAPKTFPDSLKQPEQQTEETGAEGYVLPLSVCIAVLFAAVVLFLYKWTLRRRSDGLTTRGQSPIRNNNSGRNVQLPACHKRAPVPRCADFTSPADPIYNNL